MTEKRRTFTPEFKFSVVMSLITGKQSLAQLSREHGVKDSVISRWRDKFIEHGADVFRTQASDDADKRQIAELERLLGRKTVELEAAKKVSNWLKSL